MSIYEENIKGLKECMPQWIDEVDLLEKIQVDDNNIFIEDGIICTVDEGKKIHQESQNGERERKIFFGKIEEKKENLIIVLGCLNRNVLFSLQKYMKNGSKVIIFEPNKEYLKWMLTNVDLTDVLKAGSIMIWWGGMNSARKYDLIQYSWTKFVYNICIVTCPGYYKYIGTFSQEVKKIKDLILQYYYSLGNALDDVLQGIHQEAMNFIPCMESNSLEEIRGKFKGVPAFIVASGPSLEKNIEELKKVKGKGLILACDASYEICKKFEIHPDVIATIERIEKTYKYFYENKEFDERTVLVAPSLIWPETFCDFKGKKILISKEDGGIDSWWNRQFDNVKHLSSGMSCANLAFSLALEMGCEPIVFVGQDLAYTDDKYHSDIVHAAMEGKNEIQKDSDDLYVEAMDGGKIRTSFVLNIFRLWFENRILLNQNRKVINATEGGAMIHGCENAKLKDVVEKYCNKELEQDVYALLQNNEWKTDELIEKKELVFAEINRLMRKLYKIRKKAEKHYGLLEKLYEQIEDELSKEKLIQIVKKMQRGNDVVDYLMAQSDIITFFQQYLAQTFTHVKALGNELTPGNVMANLQIQGNLMGAIKRVCVMLIGEFEKMKEEITEVIDEGRKKYEEC